jgi:predicted metal-dependent hydrolase
MTRFYHRDIQPEPLHRRISRHTCTPRHLCSGQVCTRCRCADEVKQFDDIHNDILPHMSDCSGALHPEARNGLLLFNEGKYFEAHEALEDAWNAEEGDAKNLYQGILQVAVTYLHILRGNYNGAIKVHERSKKWLNGLPDICKGVHIRELQNDAEKVMKEMQRLGKDRITQFDITLLQSVKWEEGKRIYICDRCGSEMYEKNCKVTCPNCGNRFDCSDLNIYFD